MAAAFGALLYVCAAVLVPVAHLAHHENDHAHGPSAASVDLTRLRDASGRVDLERLRQALGLDEAKHAGAHAQGTPHRHDQGQAPLAHGAGSFEHFAFALLASTPITVVPVTSAPALPAPRQLDSQAIVDRLVLLSQQRAQAPPA